VRAPSLLSSIMGELILMFLRDLRNFRVERWLLSETDRSRFIM
jgi:hypothetical protein